MQPLLRKCTKRGNLDKLKAFVVEKVEAKVEISRQDKNLIKMQTIAK